MKKCFSLLLLATSLIFSSAANAVTPSPAMIEQFKQLPRAEQEKLAKQYGFDVSLLSGSAGSNRLQGDTTEQLVPNRTNSSRNDWQFEAEMQLKQDADKTDKKELKRFGENLFDAKISTFAPVANVPVPDNYRLGPDDTLLVQVYGKQSDNFELVVNREGNINLPDIGPLNVVGLTFAQASSLIRNRISEANIGLQAAVSMGQLRSINIFVAGEARNPGMYAVSALTSVTQALFVSGGVSDIGSLRDIRVTRAGKVVTQFDLYELLLKGNNLNDITLQHGDVVFVAPAGAIVAIEGEVRRPAFYELAKGETLASLLAMAGGLQPAAHVNAVSLQRAGPNGRELLSLNLNESKAQTLSLRSGDKLVVPLLSTRVRDQVTLVGAVARPGSYAWKPNMQLHELVGNLWSDLLITTDLDYALIVRRISNRGDIEVHQFNLLQAIDSEKTPGFKPVSLQPQDIVLVFHHVNQSFERETLNSYIRKTVQNKLDRFSENALIAGDITTNYFREIESKSALIASTQFKQDEQTMSEKAIVESFLVSMLQQLYVNPDYLALSKHFTRRELLYPILQTLRKQSSEQSNIAIVSVSGDVKVPGEFPLPINGNVTHLITAAGGLNSSAYLPRAELSRFIGQSTEQNGIEQKNININLGELLAGNDSDLPLNSRDRINVFSTPDWSQIRMVNVQGEVRFPGTYQVLKGEKLSEVIQRAGGFTSSAYPYGAIFTRENIKKREAEQAAKLLVQLKSDVVSRNLTSQNALGAPAAPTDMLNELLTIEPIGRLVIDLEQMIAGRADYDIELEHQDSLYIPRIQTSVTIMGEVQHPGSHRFRAGLTVQDYLALAGGSRKRADDDRIFVIRADGSVMIPTQSRWFSATDDQLKPGDTIIMPLDTEYKDGLSLWTQVTQIFYQTAVAIAALNSF